jgi:hypothetical protein
LSEVYSRERAGRWFLDSGIQEPSGGVARYYQAEIEKNKPVSTEITGYVASALAFLYCTTKGQEFLDRARLTASFLTDQAWNPVLGVFPFEHPSRLALFFDSGIIVRGLLSVWGVTKEQRFRDVAMEAGRGMLADFYSGRDYHPILALPGKTPLDRDFHWSRTTGCYQAKSALAWWELEVPDLKDAYLAAIEDALSTYRDFLPGTSDRPRIMDRLHACCYFLEALSPLLNRSDCVEAYSYTMDQVSYYLREIAPEFVRSDVYAQLLRARIIAASVIPVNTMLANEEAEALAAFQATSVDPRIDGGFYFGRRAGELVPHINPVSTTFAVQALEMWTNPCSHAPI